MARRRRQIDHCETAAVPAGRFRELIAAYDSVDLLFRHTLGRLREGEERWAEVSSGC